MSTLQIILHNNKSHITGDRVLVNELRENPKFKIKVPNYFHMVRLGLTRGWDGFKRYITEGGLIQTGLVPELLDFLDTEGIEFDLVDKRDLFKEVADVSHIGEFKLRDVQLDAITTTLTNKMRGLRWNRGILNEATNFGKSMTAAAIFTSFSEKRHGLFLINNKVLFNQSVKEITDLLGGDIVGSVSSDRTNWKRFNICMVQTLCNRVKNNPHIRADLANTDIMIVDEGDELIGRKDTTYILDRAHNAPVRISLTGSSGLSKDKIKNKNEIAFFGPIIHATSNKVMVEKGYSSELDIRITTGNTTVERSDYQLEYEDGIIKNKGRNRRVWKRVLKHHNKGRLPIVILFKYHAHAHYLLKIIPDELKHLNIAVAHHKIKNKEHILEKFRDGKIDILLCSMIIRRGKNLPNMRVLVNAAGGDSHANAIQILGRILRKDTKGRKKYFEDFFDSGKYLKRHSKHRILYYKKQKFTVKELYK